ncbi:hypothetical protein NH8B_1967 [Pseudogulbenkiania sp. NH8B]|uniref:hypothetical protein n=1 Tax=Pseudogulbenkiania sp. (strain NH8B) TaxID=748280 RepID=UPI00022798C6|nr:hypothetical protein [Pseudogulbenkiania sp. NH8B]BAK76782.1 hypothetical protein NH8B_1967 [Pseudogulbenkiania sp. NH8B]
MPEKALSLLDALLIALGLGLTVPVARGLLQVPLPRWQVLLGRALLNGIFTVTPFSALVWWPDANPYALVGASGFCARLGWDGFNSWAERYLEKRYGKGGTND